MTKCILKNGAVLEKSTVDLIMSYMKSLERGENYLYICELGRTAKKS